MEEQLISINITIGERQYPLKIRIAEEELVRQAEHLINEKFNDFQLRFTGQEKIDYLAMSALMNLVEVLKKETTGDEASGVLLQKLSEADALLSQTLKK